MDAEVGKIISEKTMAKAMMDHFIRYHEWALNCSHINCNSYFKQLVFLLVGVLETKSR